MLFLVTLWSVMSFAITSLTVTSLPIASLPLWLWFNLVVEKLDDFEVKV